MLENNSKPLITIQIDEHHLELLLIALDRLLEQTLHCTNLIARNRLDKGNKIQAAITILEATQAKLNGSNGQHPLDHT